VVFPPLSAILRTLGLASAIDNLPNITYISTSILNVKSTLNIAVFASGRGSNFRAILKSIDEGKLNAQVVVVLSNNSDAGALLTARERGIPAVHLSRKQFQTDEEFNAAMLRLLDDHKVELIALAGYMKRLDPAIVQSYKHRILNIHPALLPSFGGQGMYGVHVHEAVIEHGCKVSGVTVHLVDEEYDHGPIVLQRAVEVADDDTPEPLAEKTLKIEHQLYSEAIQLFAEHRIEIKGRRAIVKD
jgi:phosphoribosylglycinamide formyltransferase-1